MIILEALLHEEIMTELLANAHILVLLLLVVISLASLSKGADWMVDGVVALAKKSGMPKVIIGATIVSLGTTLPETFVSVFAAFSGNPSLALGNGVGSIIADTGLIFGLAIILGKIPMDNYMMDRSGRWQAGAAVLLVTVSVAMLIVSPTNPVLNIWIGALFMLMLITYMRMSYRWAQEADSDFHEDEEESISNIMIAVLIIIGIALVILGAKILIPSVSVIAVRAGIPSDIIAATMVAFGTSLPELITAMSAIRKGHPEIIIGNVIGADVLNCLLVIGASAIAAPLEIARNFYFLHFPVMLLLLFSLRIFYHRNKEKPHFSKGIGVWMLLVYIAYVTIQYTVL